MHDVFDIEVESEVIRPDCKTDPLILKELLEHYKSMDRWCDASQEEMFSRYLEGLEDEMKRARASDRVRILPGVRDLLDTLSSQSDFAVGLATGNLENGARIKLENAGLYEYFHFGGFSSDSEDRTRLTRIGIERGMHYVSPVAVDGAFVIGDTPFDVIHGRAAGARVIAVASGGYGIHDLRLSGPDLVLSDLTPVESIISFIRSSVKQSGIGGNRKI